MNRGDLIRGILRKHMELSHIRSHYDLMRYTTIGSTTTFRKYWNDPERFPIGDLLRMMDGLNVPYEERYEVLKRDK